MTLHVSDEERPLAILMLHNRYLIGGGEDVSTRNEAQLLRQGGHQVDLVEYDNAEIEKIGKVAAAGKTIWSFSAVEDIRKRISKTKYDVLHVQNYFPLISPAVLREGSLSGLATVQALRNYRLICANAQLFRNGTDCERCIGKFVPWQGIMHGCYRNSVAGSAAIATMIGVHKLAGTWSNHTDAFISVSEYVRQKYIEGGFDASRIYAKPNVVAVAPTAFAGVQRGRQVAYVGRLAPEKGVEVLIEAWRLANRPGKLIIAGDGPSTLALKSLAEGDSTIEFLGRIPQERVAEVMATSMALVIPSRWAEPFPRTGVEALSVGTPVFGAASGGISELVGDGRAGSLYDAASPRQLADLLVRLFGDQAYSARLQVEAAELFESEYSPNAVLARTVSIYGAARNRRKGAGK